jgi:choline dehydrogenase-like flavoprotein
MPLINPGFLSTDSDMAIMVEAVKTAKRFFSASPWAGYIKGLSKDSANTTTDAQIVNYAREYTASIRHPVSTARVIDVKTGHGVVDSDLLVSQVAGLRIIDASVLVSLISSRPRPCTNLQTSHTSLLLTPWR